MKSDEAENFEAFYESIRWLVIAMFLCVMANCAECALSSSYFANQLARSTTTSAMTAIKTIHSSTYIVNSPFFP